MFLHQTLTNDIKKRWKMLVFTGIIFAVLSGIVSLAFPLEYRADAQILIISKSRYGVDPYTTVKSAERIGENLVQIVKTNDFFNKVIDQSGQELDQSRFANVTEKTKRKKWQKTIKTSVVYGTGVLNISAYHTDPNQAKLYAGAVAQGLAAQGWQYVGGDVTIKVVNDPVVGKWPVRPNIFLNLLTGFVVGILLGFVLIFKRKLYGTN